MQKILSALKNTFDVRYILAWRSTHLNIVEDKKYVLSDHKLLWYKNENEYLEKILKNYPPDILLVDFFPFGRYKHIDKFLFLLYSVKKYDTKSYSIMRDIYDGERLLESSKIKYQQLLRKKIFGYDWINFFHCIQEIIIFSYKNDLEKELIASIVEYSLKDSIIDDIFVFWNLNEHDITSEVGIEKNSILQKKFKYLWYMLTHQYIFRPYWSEKYILINFWWNIFDIKKFYNILYICRKLEGIHFKIILWKFTHEGIKRNIMRDFGNSINFNFLDFLSFNEYTWVFKNAKVFIWSWGYGTCMDILSNKKESLLFVNSNETVVANMKEQSFRIHNLTQKYNYVFDCDPIDRTFIKTLLSLYMSEQNFDSSEIKVEWKKWVIDFLT